MVSLSLNFTTIRLAYKLRVNEALCRICDVKMNANTHSLSEIIKTTAATSVWCDLHWKSAEPANSLRSPLLFPELLTRNIYGCVCDVISKRRKDLEDNKIEVSSTALKGKILVYELSLIHI